MNAAPAPTPFKRPAVTTRTPLPYWLSEFALLRWAVLAAVGALAVAVAAIFGSDWYADRADQQRQQARQARDSAHQRYAQVSTEKHEIRTYQPLYAQLRSRGLLGPENRLDWVEHIRLSQERRNMPPLSYEFTPQQTVTLDAPMALGDYEVRASRMSLHMELLHEAQLFDFLDDLRQLHYYAVQECTLKRLGGAQNVANLPTLAADCKLNWVTLAQTSAKKGWP